MGYHSIFAVSDFICVVVCMNSGVKTTSAAVVSLDWYHFIRLQVDGYHYNLKGERDRERSSKYNCMFGDDSNDGTLS